MKFNYLFFLLLLPAFFACKKTDPNAAATSAPKPGGGPTAAVEGIIAQPSVLSENVSVSGSIIPAEETELHPEAAGRVVSLNLPEGKSVKKGELLLKIFDEDLQIQQKRAEVQLKQAEITEQRLGELLKVKGVSQQEYDLAVLQIQNLRSEIELIKVNISKTELRAPYDGIIGLRRISLGAYVSPATPVASLRSKNSLNLDFSVPEKYSNLLRTGQQVRFFVEGNTREYSATIQATEQSISADSRSLMARARISQPDGLLPGAFAEVNLELGSKSKAIMIPNNAIIPQARDKKVILSKNGKAKFVNVKTGVRQKDVVEITEGLEIGDTICTTGILFLRPDSPINFAKIN